MHHASRRSTRATITARLVATILLLPTLALSSPLSVGTGAELNLVSTFTPSYLSNSSSLDVTRGVNLGGWLVLESWITPSIFDTGRTSYPDEWNLSAGLGKEAALKALSAHWSSFITRDDFVQIKAAGLNAVRIPVGYWIQDLLPYEPYVDGQYPYLIRAVQWAGEVGIKVLIGLHGAPGSQNGNDHSGLVGPVEFMANQTNVDRTLSVLKNLTAEFTQPQYGGVVSGISVLNEPRLTGDFNMAALKRFYTQASEIIWDAALSNVEVVIHDAFWGPNYWSRYDPLASSSSSASPDWLTLDTHQYYAFAPFENLPRQEILQHICNISRILKSTSSGMPKTIVGEWSLETGTPPNMTRGRNGGGLTQEKRTWFRKLFEAQLAAYTPNGLDQPSQGFYYWTWSTEYDIDTWSYKYGLANGYIPRDISNASELVFPVLAEGCIDAGFPYQAPERSSGRSRLGSGGFAFGAVAVAWLVSCL